MESISTKREWTRRQAEREVFLGKISWSAIFSGFFISILLYFLLASFVFSLGIGSLKVNRLDLASGVPVYTGPVILNLISQVLSIFSGAYFAARISARSPIRFAVVQGIVICSLFVTVFSSRIAFDLRLLGRPYTASAIERTFADAQRDPMILSALDQAFAGVAANEPMGRVVVLEHVLKDELGAANQILTRSGVSFLDAVTRVRTLKQNVDTAILRLDAQADTYARTGTRRLLFVLLFGGAASVFGGGIGMRHNFIRPVSRFDEEYFETAA